MVKTMDVSLNIGLLDIIDYGVEIIKRIRSFVKLIDNFSKFGWITTSKTAKAGRLQTLLFK